MSLDDLEKLIKIQEKEIRKLKKESQTKDEIIDTIKKEVAKAIYHQSMALEHRIDQFLFDAKIAMKDKDKEFNKNLKIIKNHLNICKK